MTYKYLEILIAECLNILILLNLFLIIQNIKLNTKL